MQGRVGRRGGSSRGWGWIFSIEPDKFFYSWTFFQPLGLPRLYINLLFSSSSYSPFIFCFHHSFHQLILISASPFKIPFIISFSFNLLLFEFLSSSNSSFIFSFHHPLHHLIFLSSFIFSFQHSFHHLILLLSSPFITPFIFSFHHPFHHLILLSSFIFSFHHSFQNLILL